MTTLIKNVQTIDGSGKPAVKADIFIRNNLIVEIGDLGRQRADRLIQGGGFYASPGFIDCATNSDHYLTLFSNPAQQDFLFQGATTTLAGMCGASLAPLLYGGLESVRKWGNISEVNVNWHTIKEFLDALQKRKLGVNFGTLVGHSTIRRALLGEVLRDLTEGELQVFEKVILSSLEGGAYGFSTGLGYAHAQDTPYYEIKRLVRLLKKEGHIYATHLRNDGAGLVASVQEVIRLAKETKVTSLITHMHPQIGYEVDYEKVLEMLEESSREADIYFTIFPFETSHVPIYSFLPQWAKNGGFDVMLSYLRSKPMREQILKTLEVLHLKKVRIAFAQGYEYLNGKLLSEFSEKRAVGLPEGLLLLMEVTRLRAIVFYQNIDYRLVLKALSHPRALVGSSSASYLPGTINSNTFPQKFSAGVGINMERKETFPKFLRLVLEEKLMSLESGIKKITALPAEIFNLKKRGVLKNGSMADIVLFSSDPISGVQIQYVFVNGELAVQDKKLQNGLSGTILRRG